MWDDQVRQILRAQVPWNNPRFNKWFLDMSVNLVSPYFSVII